MKDPVEVTWLCWWLLLLLLTMRRLGLHCTATDVVANAYTRVGAAGWWLCSGNTNYSVNVKCGSRLTTKIHRGGDSEAILECDRGKTLQQTNFNLEQLQHAHCWCTAQQGKQTRVAHSSAFNGYWGVVEDILMWCNPESLRLRSGNSCN